MIQYYGNSFNKFAELNDANYTLLTSDVEPTEFKNVPTKTRNISRTTHIKDWLDVESIKLQLIT